MLECEAETLGVELDGALHIVYLIADAVETFDETL